MRTNLKHRHVILSLLYGLMLLCRPSFAVAKAVDAAQIGNEPLALATYIDVLEDPSGQLSLTDVQKPDIAASFVAPLLSAGTLNFGLSDSAYWLRLKVRNTSDRTLDQLLEISYSRLIRIDFFRRSAGLPDQVIESGYSKPFEDSSRLHHDHQRRAAESRTSGGLNADAVLGEPFVQLKIAYPKTTMNYC